MPGIFISYRRKDSAGSTGRLHDRLCLEFGKEEIFIDVEDIPVGQPFVEYIKQQVRACSVVLVIIGPQWTTMPDASGKPRIHNPDDVVHLEIATALQERKPIIPVLVEQATMPQPHELPQDLVPLTSINASELPARHWEQAVVELIDVLRRLLPQVAPPRPHVASPTGQTATSVTRKQQRFGGARLLALGAVVGFALVVGAMLLAPNPPADPAVTASDSTNLDLSSAAAAPDSESSAAVDALPNVEDVEESLAQANIVLSTGTDQDIERVRGYMADPAGAYYLLARGCLEIMGDRQLAQTGYLDMIDKWYTIVVGGEEHYLTPEGTLDEEAIKEAVIRAQNDYHGETATSFDEVLAPAP